MNLDLLAVVCWQNHQSGGIGGGGGEGLEKLLIWFDHLSEMGDEWRRENDCTGEKMHFHVAPLNFRAQGFFQIKPPTDVTHYYIQIISLPGLLSIGTSIGGCVRWEQLLAGCGQRELQLFLASGEFAKVITHSDSRIFWLIWFVRFHLWKCFLKDIQRQLLLFKWNNSPFIIGVLKSWSPVCLPRPFSVLYTNPFHFTSLLSCVFISKMRKKKPNRKKKKSNLGSLFVCCHLYIFWSTTVLSNVLF